jgi:16S rRNA processing protein RimM
VTRPVDELLWVGKSVTLRGAPHRIARRAGTAARPIIRLDGLSSREAIEEVRGAELLVPSASLPALEPGEYWAHDLVGCRVVDGSLDVGVVARMVALPSCEALEVDDLLIPLVRDAIRSIDLDARVIDVRLDFLGA